MTNATEEVIAGRGFASKDVLREVLREGAQRRLTQAVEDEVAAYVEEHVDEPDENGHRLVVRNGHHRRRTIETGIGPVEVPQRDHGPPPRPRRLIAARGPARNLASASVKPGLAWASHYGYVYRSKSGGPAVFVNLPGQAEYRIHVRGLGR